MKTCGQLSSSPRRNPVKELVLTMASEYFGPDECIDDHVLAKYFDNPEVCYNIILCIKVPMNYIINS